jgi:hypothetical protein
VNTSHAIQIQFLDASGDDSRMMIACCACGWTGPARDAWNMARHDGSRHVGPLRSSLETPVSPPPAMSSATS